MNPARLFGGLLVSAALFGCSDKNPAANEAPRAAPVATVATTTSAPPSASVAAPPEPVCRSVERRVWSGNVNTRTGLTPAVLAGGVAIGVALGDRPQRLWFDDKGSGKLEPIALPAGHELAKKLGGSDGTRHLQRVTLAKDGVAFADYRDKHASGRRRIACGSLAGEAPLLWFDGTPLLEVDDSGKEEGAAPAPSASAVLPVEAPPPAAEVKREGSERDPRREVRDCRSFSDVEGKDRWGIGSILRGEEKDGAVEWFMDFVVVADGGRTRSRLHAVKLGTEPKKLHTLEAPVAHRLADGSFVVAGRYKGQMQTWLLGADKKKKSELQQYGGGYPSLPRIIADGGEHLLLTSQKVDLSRWKLRALRLAPGSALLESLLEPKVGTEDASLAEPTLARIGDQRWLAYQSSDKKLGRISVVPVDAELAEVGKAHVVAEVATAYESHLFATGDGKLLLVSIQRADSGKPNELVSDLLSCSVQK